MRDMIAVDMNIFTDRNRNLIVTLEEEEEEEEEIDPKMAVNCTYIIYI